MLFAEDRIDTAFFPYGPGSQCGMIHNDHLATPQKLTDSTGQVVWAADYKPFGEATITVSTITNNLRFPGQYFDAETGLNYNYYRDYNPIIGRYVQSDISGINGGTNHLYAFVQNNPLMFVDFFGLSCEVLYSNTHRWQDTDEKVVYGDWIYDSYSRFNMACWCNFHRAKRIDVTLTEHYITITKLLCKEKDKCGKEKTYTKLESTNGSFTTQYSKYGGTETKVESGTMFATPGKEKSGGGCSCQPIAPPPPGIYSN